MAFSVSHDETSPIDHTSFQVQPGAVRNTKTSFRERLQFGGMYFPSTHDELAGEHSYVRMAQQGSAPMAVASKWHVYAASDGLHIVAPDGTNSTLSAIPAGLIMLYDGAACPTGYTRVSALDGAMIKAGAVYAAPSAAAAAELPAHAHPGPSHTHTTPAHQHTLNARLAGQTTLSNTTDTPVSSTAEIQSGGGGTSGAGGTGATDSAGSGTKAVLLLCKKD